MGHFVSCFRLSFFFFFFFEFHLTHLNMKQHNFWSGVQEKSVQCPLMSHANEVKKYYFESCMKCGDCTFLKIDILGQN